MGAVFKRAKNKSVAIPRVNLFHPAYLDDQYHR